jgi:hypothetical protein
MNQIAALPKDSCLLISKKKRNKRPPLSKDQFLLISKKKRKKIAKNGCPRQLRVP